MHRAICQPPNSTQYRPSNIQLLKNRPLSKLARQMATKIRRPKADKVTPLDVKSGGREITIFATQIVDAGESKNQKQGPPSRR